MPRPRKPTQTKILDGTREDRINRNEPKNKKPKTIAPPAHLDVIAKAEWRRIIRECDPGLILASDIKTLELYCYHYSLWREATKKSRSEKYIKKTINGHLQPSDWYSISMKQSAILLKLLTELGFTPSSRSKVEVRTGPQSDLKDFLTKFAAGKSKPKPRAKAKTKAKAKKK